MIETYEDVRARNLRRPVTALLRAELYREAGAGRCPVCTRDAPQQLLLKERGERPVYTCVDSPCARFWRRCIRFEQTVQHQAQLRSYGRAA